MQYKIHTTVNWVNWTFKLFSKIGSVGFNINNLCPLINLVKIWNTVIVGVFLWGGGGGRRAYSIEYPRFISKSSKSSTHYLYKPTCRCHANISTNWWEIRPYIGLTEDSKLTGVFPVVLRNIVESDTKQQRWSFCRRHRIRNK